MFYFHVFTFCWRMNKGKDGHIVGCKLSVLTVGEAACPFHQSDTTHAYCEFDDPPIHTLIKQFLQFQSDKKKISLAVTVQFYCSFLMLICLYLASLYKAICCEINPLVCPLHV